MVKNPPLIINRPPPQPVKIITAEVWIFKDGLHAPATLEKFTEVQDWNTPDNALFIKGKNYIYVCPPGMWLSIMVREVG